MLLENKRLLITGVLTPQSIAFAAAQACPGAGRRDRAHRLRPGDEPHAEGARSGCPIRPTSSRWTPTTPRRSTRSARSSPRGGGRLDGFLHAIAFAPQDALGGNFLHTPWESVATAVQTSAFSLKAIAVGHAAADGRGRWLDRLAGLRRPGRLADLRLDGRGEGRPRVRDALPRPRPRSQGDPGEHRERRVRCKTMAGKGIPGFDGITDSWASARRSAGTSPTPRRSATRWRSCSRTCPPASRGELIHVDGGFHAMGTDLSSDRGAS